MASPQSTKGAAMTLPSSSSRPAGSGFMELLWRLNGIACDLGDVAGIKQLQKPQLSSHVRDLRRSPGGLADDQSVDVGIRAILSPQAR